MLTRLLSAAPRAWRSLLQANPPAAPAAASRLGDLLAVPDAWQPHEGFHHPDWKRIASLINDRAATEPERQATWHDASLQWLDRLRNELGSGFRIGQSRNFLIVSSKSDVSLRYFLGQCESALAHLRMRLGEAAWRWQHGRHAVLVLEDEEAYYRYISHFFPDGGAYGTSSGMCLRKGYCHTVLAPQPDLLPTLVHELTHLCLKGQRLPTWLEEGLATHLERELTGRGAHRIDRESIAGQRAYWNGGNIQRFWSGASFVVGEERKHSYGLAEHLAALLSREFPKLGPFICAAHREDGGQAAALRCLDMDLQNVAAAFLGEGDWQPRPAEW